MISYRKVTAVAAASILELFRRKDVYVALILAAAIIFPLTTVALFGVEGVVRYLREIALMLMWLFSIVLTITTAARQFPGEIQRRTILPLLSKPVRRSEVVLGKFVGATSASSLALVLFYVCYAILVGGRTGSWISWVLVQAFILHVCFLALVTALTLLGSMILTPSANITCCTLVVVSMLLFGQQLPEFAGNASTGVNGLVWVVHAVAPHFEFYDLRIRLVHEWGIMPLGIALGIVAYTVVYAAVLLSATVYAFKRKRL
ncbi:MAG: ABC transporter permease [Candidatus Pacebacteria bacterium]|nr:ABC transporter permease [Candidatus Paceibacterota bacterium]